MKFDERLMSLRKAKGWSQEELANKIGVSRQTISKWESFQTIPDMNKLMELSKIFEISVDELINEENKEEKENKVNIFTKINLKPTNILLIIACILIFIGLIIIILLYKHRNSNKLYVDDIIMITYSRTMIENVYVTEIYSFDENEQCIGSNFYVSVINNSDYDNIVKDIINRENEKINMLYNIEIKENEITWSKKINKKVFKNDILEEKKNVLSRVQNLKIIDM